MTRKRVKYKLKDGRYVNTTPLQNKNGDKILVEYSLEDFTFRISNPKTNHIYKGGERVNNYQTLLRNIRKRLKIMGVELESEVRDV